MTIRKKIFLLGRGFVSLILLGYLVTMIDGERLRSVLKQIDSIPLIWPPLLILCGFFLASLRWKTLLSSFHIQKKIPELYLCYLISSFYGFFLPGVTGGDVIRAGKFAYREGGCLAAVSMTILLERFFGVAALLIICGITLFLFPVPEPIVIGNFPITSLPLLIAILFFILLVAMLFIRFFAAQMAPALEASNTTLGRIAHLLQEAIQLPSMTIVILLSLSSLSQVCDILAVYFLASALKISIAPTPFFFILPVVYLATALPISLGGIGVREGVLVYFLTQMGIHASDAITLSFLIYINRLLISGLGGLLQFLPENKKTVMAHNGR